MFYFKSKLWFRDSCAELYRIECVVETSQSTVDVIHFSSLVSSIQASVNCTGLVSQPECCALTQSSE